MMLTAGTKLGPYTVEAPLGAGGMGEVYRGRDTRLDRPVAIKVLSQTLAETPELRERFEREARLLSNLNHPHICVVYDVGHQDGVSYLVMELLDGETLADRIARGPLPVPQATSIALQIGGALDRAHRIGVVHRDVKPENVMLTKSGAKLLDFGLAKPAPVPADLGGATRTLPLTGQGTILGTLQYMAPEQLEGRPADVRSDIFAFGAVLYEMITGKRAFDGGTPASVISAILRDTPRPISEIQPFVPAALDVIVRTCLEKDPDDRWHSAHDLASQLRFIHQSGTHSQSSLVTPAVSRRRTRYVNAAWILGCVSALAVGAFAGRYLRSTPPAESIRFAIAEPAGSTFGKHPIAPFAAVSPDGRYIVFDATKLPGPGLLHLRALNTQDARRLSGTEGAWLPFWSADSKYVGFFADGALKKTSIATGGVETICRIEDFEGASWNQDNVVLISKPAGGLLRVSASGGDPVPATTLDHSRNEVVHRAPVFLPDGRHFIFLAQPGNVLFFASLDGGPPRRLLTVDAKAVYSPPGYLLFARDGALVAQPFDAKRGELTGDPVRVADNVRAAPLSGRAGYSVSQTGVLVYRAGDARSTSDVRWIDRSGKRGATVLENGEYSGLALSPDGGQVAFHKHEDPLGGGIWVKNLARGEPVRLTADQSHNGEPSWSPDGLRLVFSSNRSRNWDLYGTDGSGAGREQVVLRSADAKYYPGWSTDGKFLIYQVYAGANQSDIWVWPQDGRQAEPYINSGVDEVHPRFSPDGKWVAYAAADTGRLEVYVQPYPRNGQRYAISVGGGLLPQWRRDGREIFYLTASGTVQAVDVSLDGGVFKPGAPQRLFDLDIAGLSIHDSLFQPTPDGREFLVVERRKRNEPSAPEPLSVVVNWSADLAGNR